VPEPVEEKLGRGRSAAGTWENLLSPISEARSSMGIRRPARFCAGRRVVGGVGPPAAVVSRVGAAAAAGDPEVKSGRLPGGAVCRRVGKKGGLCCCCCCCFWSWDCCAAIEAAVGVAALEAVPVANAVVVVTVGRFGGDGRGGPEVLVVVLIGSGGNCLMAVGGRFADEVLEVGC
jgi:hypothetical protein